MQKNRSPNAVVLEIMDYYLRKLILIPYFLLASTPAAEAGSALLKIEFTPRSPEQMAAFYEARGFPRPMIDILKQQCFITVRIHNNGEGVIWAELDNWHFDANGKTLKREHRDYWKRRWEDMQVPLASQSTFRWTLLPEALDYQPGETEGGNIILPRTGSPITLQATFRTGVDKNGPVIRRRYENLRCAEDKK